MNVLTRTIIALVILVLVAGCGGEAPFSALEPINTLRPTDTLAPTATPKPTSTPPPAATAEPTATEAPQPTHTPAPSPTPTKVLKEARVVEVVDGDTIKVELDGRIYTVRYIGIDTPEIEHPTKFVEWMGPEASAANAELVEGKTCLLERDVSEGDQYGRLLRYVYVGNVFVNLELVRRGFAKVRTRPPDVKYTDLFTQAQKEARRAGRGLWSATPTPSAVPTQPPPPTVGPTESLPPPTRTIPPPAVEVVINACHVTLRWRWPGTLAADVWFSVAIRRRGESPEFPRSESFTRESLFTVTLSEPGWYDWEIAACRGDLGVVRDDNCASARGEFRFPGCPQTTPLMPP